MSLCGGPVPTVAAEVEEGPGDGVCPTKQHLPGISHVRPMLTTFRHPLTHSAHPKIPRGKSYDSHLPDEDMRLREIM